MNEDEQEPAGLGSLHWLVRSLVRLRIGNHHITSSQPASQSVRQPRSQAGKQAGSFSFHLQSSSYDVSSWFGNVAAQSAENCAWCTSLVD